MDWTPEEIKKLVRKFGGTAVMAEIMRVTPHSIENMIAGGSAPSRGAGIAMLNLINILDETLSKAELSKIVERLRTENFKIPRRQKRSA